MTISKLFERKLIQNKEYKIFNRHRWLKTPMHIETLDRMGASEAIVGIVQAGIGFTPRKPIKAPTKDMVTFTASHR